MNNNNENKGQGSCFIFLIVLLLVAVGVAGILVGAFGNQILDINVAPLPPTPMNILPTATPMSVSTLTFDVQQPTMTPFMTGNALWIGPEVTPMP